METSNLPRKNIDIIVSAAGTGGTVTGLSHAIRACHARRRNAQTNGKSTSHQNGLREALQRNRVEANTERCPRIVAVDPVGSILGGGSVAPYEVEGIG
jgi:cysteine synthase